MSFARNRLRKQSMPQMRPSNLQVSQAPSPRESDSFDGSSSVTAQRKWQARGAIEREDLDALRQTLSSNPAQSETHSQTHLPQSHFEWDDSSEGSSMRHTSNATADVNADATANTKTKANPNENLRSFQRAKQRAEAYTQHMQNLHKASSPITPREHSVDGWMDNAQKFAEEKRSVSILTAAEPPLGPSQGSLNAFASSRSGSPPAISRESIYKSFVDPLWDAQKDDVMGFMRREPCPPKGPRYPVIHSPLHSAGSKIRKAETPSLENINLGKSSHEPLNYPAQHKQTLVEDVDVGKKGKVNVGKKGSPNVGKKESLNADKRGDVGGIRKDTTIEVKSEPVSEVKDKNADDGKKIPSDPFLDGDDDKRLARPILKISATSPAGNARSWNDFPWTPTRDEKQKQAAANVPKGFTLRNTSDQPERAQESIITSGGFVHRLMDSPNVRNAKGYPRGPEDPNWDDAVKRVKKLVAESEKREAARARLQKKETSAMEKKLQKLKAGKNAVLRGSEFGLTTRKPLEDITEDEFEAVGGFAMTSAEETPATKKTSILGSVFTRMLGTSQQKREQVAQTEEKLEKHRSLDLLKLPAASELLNSPVEDVTQYLQALQALSQKQDEEPSPSIAASEVSRSFSGRAPGTGEQATTQLHRSKTYQKGLSGLGISENSKPYFAQSVGIKSASHEGVIQRRHLGWGSNNGLTESAAQHPQLSGAVGDDASSCSTGSIHSAHDMEPLTRCSGLPHTSQRRHTGSSSSLARDSEMGRQISFGPSQRSDESGSIYGEDEASGSSGSSQQDATPSPLNLQILRVKRSMAHIQPADPNSFIPDRKASFHAKIHAASELQTARLGSRSHPALRSEQDDVNEGGQDADVTQCGSSSEFGENRPHSASPSTWPEQAIDEDEQTGNAYDQVIRAYERAANPHEAAVNANEGVINGSGQAIDKTMFNVNGNAVSKDKQVSVADEGYGTGSVGQSEFKDTVPMAATSPESGNKQHWQVTSQSRASAARTESLRSVDVQALRAEVGLGPLQLASANNLAKHPHHPFTWDHEKVMCRDVHNAAESALQHPKSLRGNHESRGDIQSKYIGGSPPQGTAETSETCDNCGSFCCRYASLIMTSRIRPRGDVAQETVRAKAQAQLDQLRSEHPDGVEDYNTFLLCNHCAHLVCPDCAKKCNDPKCHAIVCSDCADEDEECPVHKCF